MPTDLTAILDEMAKRCYLVPCLRCNTSGWLTLPVECPDCKEPRRAPYAAIAGLRIAVEALGAMRVHDPEVVEQAEAAIRAALKGTA
jgi:hypothetical protein